MKDEMISDAQVSMMSDAEFQIMRQRVWERVDRRVRWQRVRDRVLYVAAVVLAIACVWIMVHS